VTGQFEVLLDFESGTGVVQSLNVTLVDVETLIATPDEGLHWMPGPSSDLFDVSRLLDYYKPPYSGVLQPLDDTWVLSPKGVSVSSLNQYIPPDPLSHSIS
jgi:hypothetical protein